MRNPGGTVSNRPAYRIDADAVFDRIKIREKDRASRAAEEMRRAVDTERDLITCQKCLSKFNMTHFATCPYCAVRAFPRPTEPAA